MKTPVAALIGLGLLLSSPHTVSAQQATLPLDQATEVVVRPGETLGGIANRTKVPRILIAEANGLKEPYSVRAGQRLKIPRTRHHRVVAGETGFTIAYNYGVAWRDIAVANGLEPGARVRAGQRLVIPTIIAQPDAGSSASASSSARFAWPVMGNVRRGFTPRTHANHHDGIDIRADLGTAVRAAAAGKVLFAGEEPRQFGKLVVIDHGNGWNTAYGFLSRITVKEGDQVSAGERVGLVGRTGMARGSELHFEMRRNNRPVDPGSQLPQQQPIEQ